MTLSKNKNLILASTATAVIALCGASAFAGSHSSSGGAGSLSAALAEHYTAMAAEEKVEQDKVDEAHFSAKGTYAAAGQDVRPDAPTSRTLNATDQVFAEQTYNRIQAAYNDGAADKHPNLLADAQANYDCFIQEAEEGYQLLHIWRCQDAAVAALDAMEKPMMAEVDPKPKPEPAALPPQQQDFTVYFGFDSSQIGIAARNTIVQIADAAREYDNPSIYVTGHADTSGPRDYNMRLSARRADAVADALTAQGLSSQRVDENAVGEVLPAVSTGDGVREPLNRRVTVSVRDGR